MERWLHLTFSGCGLLSVLTPHKPELLDRVLYASGLARLNSNELIGVTMLEVAPIFDRLCSSSQAASLNSGG